MLYQIMAGMSGAPGMPFLVGEDLRKFFLAEPESGMGYQSVRSVDGSERFCFILVSPQPVSIACGTVAPAFGQAGGGVEVRFHHATPPQTFKRHIMISDR